MPAKKTPTLTIGRHKGKKVFITKKKAPDGFVVVRLEDKSEITVPKNIIQ